jgi:MYXO-CTERM domain-containing protein
VAFDATLDTTSDEVAGVQVDIAFDAEAAIVAKEDDTPSCAVNPAIGKEATSFAFQPSGCTPGEDCTAVRAIVLALDNLEPIPDDAKLFTCDVALAADAAGDYPLTCSNAGAGDVNGNRLGADCTDGTITAAVVTDATIVIADAVGSPGTNTTLSVSLETEIEVAGTQNDTTFPAGVGVVADNRGRPTCLVNPEIEKGGASFAFQPSGCTPGDDCTGVRALVLALDNVDPIPSGSLLYTCEVAIGDELENGRYPLVCTNAGASDPDGVAVATACDAGDVVVGIQEITFTPTNTPTQTPTATGSVGTPTNTPTVSMPPTASSTPTRTRQPKRDEDDGCQVVAPAEGGAAWLLLLPAAVLLWRRRR